MDYEKIISNHQIQRKFLFLKSSKILSNYCKGWSG